MKKSVLMTLLLSFAILGVSASVACAAQAPAPQANWKAQLQKVISDTPFDVAIYVKDIASNDTFEYQVSKVFPSASLIKLFVLWDLFDQANKGNLKLDEQIVLDHNKAVDGGILHVFQSGATLRLEDLAQIMLSVSDNTAANLLIDRLGMPNINKSIQALGAKETVLGRKMLDTEAKKQGRDNFTSARDIEMILERMLKTSPRMMTMLSVQKNIAKLPALLPYQDPDDLEPILAHKTGELPGVQDDAGVFFYRTSHPVVVVVLTNNAPSLQAGCAVGAQVGKIIYDAFHTQTLPK